MFAGTNELRTRGTDNLLAAAARAGTRRVIAQSYAGPGPDKPSGRALKTEEDPLDWQPIRSAAHMAAAITYVDRTVPTAAPEGIVLRYGSFYGPGASDVLLGMVRKRQVPVIGGGAGIWSFLEITDAAAATIAAIGHGAPGVYNVVDDDPAPVAEWLPYLAQVAGAKPPLRLPAWLGRLLAGQFVVAQMTTSRGYSNQKAREESSLGCRSIRAGGRGFMPGSADKTGPRLLAGLSRLGRSLGTSVRLAWVNGQPGAIGYDAQGRVFTVFELEVTDDVVQAIRAGSIPTRLAGELVSSPLAASPGVP